MTNRRDLPLSPFVSFLAALIVLTLVFFIGYVRGIERVNSNTEHILNQTFYGIGIETRLNIYPSGLVVSDVYAGTPAKRAGIRKYDLILSINSGDAKFDRLEYVSKSGATVQLKIKRGDRTFEVSVVPELMQRKLIVTPVEIICSDCAVPYEVKNYNSK